MSASSDPPPSAPAGSPPLGSPTPSLKFGTVAMLVGLQNSPQLNGTLVVVGQQEGDHWECVGVGSIAGSNKQHPVKVKPGNLYVLQQNDEISKQGGRAPAPLSSEAVKKITEDPAYMARTLSLKRYMGDGLLPNMDVEQVTPFFEKAMRGDFTYCPAFDPAFTRHLVFAGWLPMACMHWRDNYYYLSPKLHKQRCVAPLSLVHIHKRIRKKRTCGEFFVTMDKAFPQVLQGIRQQHGDNWMSPDMVKLYLALFLANKSPKNNPNGNCTFHSFELWRRKPQVSEKNVPSANDTDELKTLSSLSSSSSTSSSSSSSTSPTPSPASFSSSSSSFSSSSSSTSSSASSSISSPTLSMRPSAAPLLSELELVAGECGYVVGSIYTSATGFSRESDAGNVQLACTYELIRRAGFKVWDFGMTMKYKEDLGAFSIKRQDWRALVQTLRHDKTNISCPELTPCYSLLGGGGQKVLNSEMGEETRGSSDTMKPSQQPQEKQGKGSSLSSSLSPSPSPSPSPSAPLARIDKPCPSLQKNGTCAFAEKCRFLH